MQVPGASRDLSLVRTNTIRWCLFYVRTKIKHASMAKSQSVERLAALSQLRAPTRFTLRLNGANTFHFPLPSSCPLLCASPVSLVRASAIRCRSSTRRKKLKLGVRLTSHHILDKSRICREFTTIRGKRQKGKVKLTLLKPVFVDLQGSNFRFQSRGRKAELGCGTR